MVHTPETSQWYEGFEPLFILRICKIKRLFNHNQGLRFCYGFPKAKTLWDHREMVPLIVREKVPMTLSADVAESYTGKQIRKQ